MEIERSKKMAQKSRLDNSSEAEDQSDLAESLEDTDREIEMGKREGRGPKKTNPN